jgi:glycosyltransferase involved in cell wall biosynthesis
VVTLHDLAWEHHTEDYSSRARHLTIAVQARFAVNRAKVVITVSQFIRASIAETYSVEPERILVAPNSVDPVFRPSQAGRTCTLLEPVGVAGAYVVALGGAKRRALPVAVEAWKRATKRGTRLPLVVVGSEPPPALDGVVYMGRLNDEDWAAILAGAVVLCYPTRYEGFGMPALEAAACGTPVVCARVGPLPEILGEAAEWCKAPTADEIAKGLERVINDPIRRATLSEAGRKAAASAPTWADSARVLIEAYRRAVL